MRETLGVMKSDPHLPKTCFICFSESPLTMIKNAFYLILKGLFVLKVFNFSFKFLVMQKKQVDQKVQVSFKIYDMTAWLKNNYNAYISQYFTKQRKLTMRFGLLTEHYKRNVFFKNHVENEADLFLFSKKALYDVKANGLQLISNTF